MCETWAPMRSVTATRAPGHIAPYTSDSRAVNGWGCGHEGRHVSGGNRTRVNWTEHRGQHTADSTPRKTQRFLFCRRLPVPKAVSEGVFRVFVVAKVDRAEPGSVRPAVQGCRCNTCLCSRSFTSADVHMNGCRQILHLMVSAASFCFS